MILFLLSFILIYGSMQAVIYASISPILPFSLIFRRLLILWMLFMVAAPILTNILDHALLTTPAKILAWTGYTWLGLSFIAFCLSLTFYLLYLILGLIDQCTPWGFFRLGTWHVAWIVLLLTLGVTLCSVWGHQALHTKRLNLSTSKLNCSKNPLKVVFITDLHLGFMAGQKSAQEIVARIEMENPDLVLCAGDLLDGNLAELEEIVGTFRRLRPELGKYAVTGNHETYIGTKQAIPLLQEAGFDVLSNEHAELDQHLTLLGLGYDDNENCEQEQSLVQDLDSKDYNILLKHAPNLCSENLNRVDLQLGGHTHKGQIFPFGLLTRFVYPYINGLYELKNNSLLYVSPGTGSWGPRMRLGTQREITIINIKGKCPGAD